MRLGPGGSERGSHCTDRTPLCTGQSYESCTYTSNDTMNTKPKSTYGGDRGGGGTTKHDALHGQPRTRRSPQPRTPLVFESTRACTDKAEGTTHASVAAASHTPGVCAAGPSRRGHTPAGGNAHPSGAARLRPLALRRPRSGRPHARPHPHASHSHATPCQDCPATHAHTLCRHGTHCVRLRHPLTLRQTPQRWQSHRRGASLEAGSRG